MRAVIQRVKKASVVANGVKTAQINQGLLVLLGVEDADTAADIDWLCGKIARMRIFNDENGVMNLSVQDIKGDIIVVSQFTLHASTVKGNRPSYIRASKGEFAQPMYNAFLEKMSAEMEKEIGAGIFGADMQVELINDGPVTIIIDSHLRE
ncbi:MAG: D-aminoacyl-tRNA deacylase [Flavobacteriales bacterium]|nr:D-aminoacyl-tRNA deacylase [Flavobacteriales bacterium]